MAQNDFGENSIGLAFPLRLGEDGRLMACSYEDHVRQSLRTLLLTGLRQRKMRPEFGSRLGDYLFENIDTTTAALVKSEIIEAIERYEPRVELGDIRVRGGGGRDIGTINVEITYTIIYTGAADRVALTLGR